MASDAKDPGATPARHWRVGVWPDPPPRPPALAFPGPIGLWDRGALIPLEQAERDGVASDSAFHLPFKDAAEELFEADQARFDRWSREESVPRGERHLALAGVDLADVDAVLDFVSTFGVLDVRALDAPRGGREWWGLAHLRATPLRILRHYPGFGDDSQGASSDSSLREAVFKDAQQERDRAPTWVIAETITEFRWGARMLSDLRLAWETLRMAGDPCQVEWENPRLREPTDPERAQWMIANFLEGTLRDALEGFSPRVWLIDRETGDSRLGSKTRPAPNDGTLLEALVCELARHMAEDAGSKQCQNPSCSRLFVRQEGGSIYGQFRTVGVRYCSRRCARVVAQRKYRQRQRDRTA